MTRGQQSTVLGLVSVLALGGCMTSGTNLHGDFACKAPGGTCAPMSMIDASAVAAIGAAQPVSGIADRPTPGRVRMVATGYEANVTPARTADRVLKVVFPAHIDTDGVFREEATAHAVIETGAWVEALRGGARPDTGAAPAPRSLIGQAEAPAAGAALATLDEILAARAAAIPSAAARQMNLAAPTMAIPSRSAAPRSLREAAAGLAAEGVAQLDPRQPDASFDVPDSVAAVLPGPEDVAISEQGHRTNVTIAADPVAPAVTLPAPAQRLASPSSHRTVRWHGRWYRLPRKHPATIESADAQQVTPPASSPTALLNRDALRKLGETPAAAPAASAGVVAPSDTAATNSGSIVPGMAANPGATK